VFTRKVQPSSLNANPRPDEESLVAYARKGDVNAFNRLVLAYQELAYNVAYRILGSEERAMDATQDAFLRGYRGLDQFRGGSFRVWILRIVTNCCYDQLRAGQRRPTTPLDDILEDEERSRLFEDPGEQPEAHVERQEFDRAIQVGLADLPDEQRVVLVMSDIEGMSYEEISRATSVPLGTIKSRLSRGRAKLRDYLRAHRELLPEGFRLRDS
jgi:RNA polymerase sigma-70 factor (ECF subfamily)